MLFSMIGYCSFSSLKHVFVVFVFGLVFVILSCISQGHQELKRNLTFQPQTKNNNQSKQARRKVRKRGGKERGRTWLFQY